MGRTRSTNLIDEKDVQNFIQIISRRINEEILEQNGRQY
jgi:hypothetical protein